MLWLGGEKNGKVEIILEQREVAFSSICENLNFSTETQIFANLLGDKNATYLWSKIISTLVGGVAWVEHLDFHLVITVNKLNPVLK